MDAAATVRIQIGDLVAWSDDRGNRRESEVYGLGPYGVTVWLTAPEGDNDVAHVVRRIDQVQLVRAWDAPPSEPSPADRRLW